MSDDAGFSVHGQDQRDKIRLGTLYVYRPGACMLKGSMWLKASKSRGSCEDADPSKCWKAEGSAPRRHFPHQLPCTPPRQIFHFSQPGDKCLELAILSSW